MWTYTTLDGRIIDLTGIGAGERPYLEQCQVAYREGMPWDQFTALAEGEGSPLVRATGGWVTRAVWEHPVFQAARDMENRLGIAQGFVGPNPDDDLNRDPFADEWVPATAAAARVGVTLTGLHKAIARGEIIARPAKPGGTRLVVSGNSLARWRPSPVRQAAGRRRGAARAASRA
ncbi:MAG TPA: hypothetical protein VII06_06830 [Chloroflexota bacterium]|jgi:hypothetical protein